VQSGLAGYKVFAFGRSIITTSAHPAPIPLVPVGGGRGRDRNMRTVLFSTLL
jgi:hypothetical protein